MNVFHKVTLQSLKKNKTRTVVTIIGIVLSAAMICGVTTLVSSTQNYILQNTIYLDGNWHGNASDTDRKTLKTIQNSDLVEETVYGQILGYAVAEGCKNQYKPYIHVLGMSEGFETVMPVHLSAGNYPKAPNEILLPEHLNDNGGVNHRIGDVITLALGERISEGYRLNQYNPLNVETVPVGESSGDNPGGESASVQEVEIVVTEELQIRESRTYLVVGFYQRPSFENYSAPGYTALTVADASPREDAKYDIYFRMKNPRDVYDFMEENNLSGRRNNDVLMMLGTVRYDSFYAVLWSLASIVTVLILFGSVALIYNAFSISVSERTKQFGLLSSIGATKKQLRRMVLFEAIAVSAVGIPLGILSGIGGIAITLLIIGNRFKAWFDYSIPMRISVSPASVIAAVAVALITVLISVWIPSRRAMKVSAVEAIRQNNEIKTRKKDVKTPKWIYKIFGLPGVLANKHYRRNRKKYRTTVVSLFMSVVLFVSAAAFTDYLTASVQDGLDRIQYDIRYTVSGENLGEKTPEELLQLLNKSKGVTDGKISTSDTVEGRIDLSQLSEAERNKWSNAAEDPQKTASILFYECSIPDGEFRALLQEHGLPAEDYFDPEHPLGLALDGGLQFDAELGRYVATRQLEGNGCVMTVKKVRRIEGFEADGYETDETGNRIYRYVSKTDPKELRNLPEAEALIPVEYRAETVLPLRERPYSLPSGGIVMLYPMSMTEALNAECYGDSLYDYYFLASDHASAFSGIRKLLVENGYSSNNLYDYAENAEQERSIVTIIKVLSYGFTVLISLIAAANVFNTVSTNIALRRREFAMLKSVGMTAGGFNRMMCFECLLYGTKALLWGLPVSGVVTVLIYLSIDQGMETPFRLPWSAMILAVVSVFTVVFASMIYAMHKIKKDNPIDALKNENL